MDAKLSLTRLPTFIGGKRIAAIRQSALSCQTNLSDAQPWKVILYPVRLLASPKSTALHGDLHAKSFAYHRITWPSLSFALEREGVFARVVLVEYIVRAIFGNGGLPGCSSEHHVANAVPR